MRIRKLQNSDVRSLEKFLSAYAETSMFLRSNSRASGLEYKDERYHGEYIGSIAKTGEINGVIAHFWNGNIMMQAVDKVNLNQLIHVFRESVSRPVVGILGSSAQSDAVITGLGLSDEVFTINRDEGLYALDLNRLILPSNIQSQRYQMIEAREVGKVILIQWLKAYENEAFGTDDNEDLDTYIQSRIDGIMSGSDCWVLMVDKQPVSLSGFNARLPDVVQIGPVWTPPKYRNNGYARNLVALTLKKSQEEDVKKAILFTDNPAAIKSYESIGFKEVGTYRLALLKDPIVIV